jgi:protein phosphatase
MPIRGFVVSSHQERGGRSDQEDAHAFFRPPDGCERRGSLFLIADGMGGATKGATASSMAVEFLRNSYYRLTPETPSEMGIQDLLGRLIPEANRYLVSRASEDKGLWGMGTTLIATALANGRLYWGAVGDSHLYLVRSGRLILLNEDHSFAGEVKRLVAAGRIAPETAQLYENQGHKLLHYLGNPHFNHFDLCKVPLLLQDRDQVMLCTDGLYQNLEDQAILQILEKNPPETAASTLTKEALERGGPRSDNITVQVISML